MRKSLASLILNSSKATGFDKTEVIQTLWSGYGEISRYQLSGSDRKSLVVKHVKLPEDLAHPRGWNSDLSHRRKVYSYQVESTWYRDYSQSCNSHCRVPEFLAENQSDGETLIVMEDLQASGFSITTKQASMTQMLACLRWLANFHATFLDSPSDGLWDVGTYWHLATRPDELAALTDHELRAAAKQIDQVLQDCPYQTLVHGDAKLANFCFSEHSDEVAAVDFQYIGRGCGIKDVAYFIGSCLDEDACKRYEKELLDHYFSALQDALLSQNKTLNSNKIETSWRQLYPFAWTDFHRFVKGWSPGHWKIHGYSEGLAKQVIESLKNGTLPNDEAAR